MAEGCCQKMIKYFMFLINFLFAIAGLVLIGIGGYIQINAKSYLDFLSDNYLNTPIFIIIAGCIIFVIAFFGCCGAWQESSGMIYIYAVLLAVILIAEVAAGIAALVLKGQLKEVIEEKMKQGMQNYNAPESKGVHESWDMLQSDLKCCGVRNYTDWKTVFPDGKTVPDSCCISEAGIVTGCGTNFDMTKIYTKGCLVQFEDQMIHNIGIVGGVALGIGLIQIIGVVFSCYLGNGIRKQGQYV